MLKIDIILESYYNYLLIGVGFFIFTLFRLLDFNGLYGQDAYEYYNYANSLVHFWQGGENPSSCHFPIFYSVISSFLGLIFPLTYAMQALTMCSFMLVFYFLKKMLGLLYPNLQYLHIYLLLFGSLSPYFFRLGICVMSDMLAIAAFCGLLFHSLRFLNTQKTASFILAFIFAFIAIMTRYASILVVFPPLLFLLYHAYKRQSLRKLSPFLILSFISLLFFIYLKKSYLYSLTTHTAYINWSFSHFFSNHFQIQGEGILTYTFPNILYGTFHYLHPAYLLLAPMLLFFVRKKDFKIPAFILLSAAIYVVFLMGFPTQNIRLQTFMMPFLLIFFANAFQRFCECFILKYKLTYPFLIFSLLLSIVLIHFSTKSIIHFHQVEKYISLKINKINSPAIYTLGMEGALKAYQVPFPIHSLFNEKLDSIAQNSLVLLPPNFSTQWKGHLAMQNWDFIETHYKLEKTFPLPDKWEIWKITHSK